MDIQPEDYFSYKEMCRRMMERLPDFENGEELLRTAVEQMREALLFIFLKLQM